MHRLHTDFVQVELPKICQPTTALPLAPVDSQERLFRGIEDRAWCTGSTVEHAANAASLVEILPK